MQPEQPSEAAQAGTLDVPSVSRRTAWYGVAVLSIVQLFSFIDRQALSLLIAPIKADFGMSDVQVSLVIGLGFALAYAVAGLPIGRLVDQWSRPLLLALGLSLWSLSTAACGFARSFGQLALFRSGVGIGEATLTPAVISFLGDYFPPSKRGISFGVFAVSVYVGSGLSLVAGSAIIQAFQGVAFVSVPVVGDVKPWQLVFLLIGLPGLLVVPLVLTLFEPRRRGAAARAAAGRNLSLREVLAHYRRHWRAFLTQHAASTMMAMLFYGVSAWVPEFLRRTYDMPIATAGFSFGAVTVFAGSCGVLLGGLASDTLLKRGYTDARLRATLFAALGAFPFAVAFPLASSAQTSLALLAGMIFFTSTISTAGSTGVQDLALPRMRGVAAAVYLFIFNGIGLSLGPTLFAVLTDEVFGSPALLWRSLAVAAPCIAGLAAVFALAGLRPYRDCVAAERTEALLGPAPGE